MIDPVEKRIISKYLNKEASENELKHLCEWLKGKQNQEIFKDYIKTDHLLRLKYESFNSEEAYDDFMKNIESKKRINLFAGIVIRPRLKYAAIFIGILMVSTFLITKINSKKIPLNLDRISLQVINGSTETFYIEDIDVLIKKNGVKIGAIKNGSLTHLSYSSKKQSKTYYNVLRIPYGKRYEVYLTDGTHIYLNAGSELKYPSYFSDNSSREVYLKGEAYFEVAKDEKRPFIVRTNDLKTKVYGTKFNVSAYSNENSTQVVLVEGLVGVQVNKETENEYVLIKPSQKGYKLKNKNDVQIEDVEVVKYIAWKDGVLMFENESTENIFKVLERHFNIIIQNNYSELNDHRFTGTFKQESLDDILNTISNHTHFDFFIKNETIVINK